MIRVPEVRINLSELLYYGSSTQMAEQYGEEIAPIKSCREWAEAYRVEWAKNGERLLKAAQGILDLEYYCPVIDVSLAPFFRAQSSPLIMGFGREPDEFVDELTHELLHVLLTDNTIFSTRGNGREFKLAKEWVRLFGEQEDWNTLVHIPVHAVHKKLYLQEWEDESRLQRDIDDIKKRGATAYLASYEYVEEHGYDEIIAQLKESYAGIANEVGKS